MDPEQTTPIKKNKRERSRETEVNARLMQSVKETLKKGPLQKALFDQQQWELRTNVTGPQQCGLQRRTGVRMLKKAENPAKKEWPSHKQEKKELGRLVGAIKIVSWKPDGKVEEKGNGYGTRCQCRLEKRLQDRRRKKLKKKRDRGKWRAGFGHKVGGKPFKKRKG